MGNKRNVLVTDTPAEGKFEQLKPHANMIWLDHLDAKKLEDVLPTIDAILVQSWWPDSLTPRRLARMKRLRFIQSGYAGVNHIPFKSLGEHVRVSSNAGGFSLGVAEFALALLMAAAKRVVELDLELRSGKFQPLEWGSLVREIMQLSGSTLGILGYGGIGKTLGAMGRSLGMSVIAFSRHPGSEDGVEVFQARRGLLKVLSESDAVAITLPLSKQTIGLIGASELAAMKREAILVNVARAEIVDEGALFRHLRKNPKFIYATDVWRIEQGKETYSAKFPFMKLKNFIGTPHVAGGSSSLTGEPMKAAAENLLRYLRGEEPRNIVDPSEYV